VKRSLRFAVLARDSFTCRYCGAQAPHVYLEVDHVEPKSWGGRDDMDNLVTACFDCNRGKRDRDATDSLVGHDWIRSLTVEQNYLLGRLETLDLIARIADVLLVELSAARGELESDVWDWATTEAVG
jgi:hypothetical protein